MLVLHIFAALVWASAVVGILVLGVMAIVAHARWTDHRDVPVPAAMAGIAVRVLVVCAMLSGVIGIPLMALGWA